MLARSAPLPLVIDYSDEDLNVTAEDEEGIIIALEQHDRVHRIRFLTHALYLQKLIMAIDEEYPVLKYLIVEPSKGVKSTAILLPETLQASSPASTSPRTD